MSQINYFMSHLASKESLPLVGYARPGLLGFGFHIFSFLNLSSSLWLIFQPNLMSAPETGAIYGGLSNFLTFWGLLLTWLTFLLKLVLYVSESFQGSLTQLHANANLIALPLETLISLVYWPIFLYDPSLIMPPPPAVKVELSFDLALHLFPAVLLWIDHLCFASGLDTSNAIWIIILFTILYSSWIESTSAYGNNRQMPYPFLTLATVRVRCIIYVSCATICYFLLLLATSVQSSKT